MENLKKILGHILCLYVLVLMSGCSSQVRKGYPMRENVTDLYKNFQNPPEGYGEVPFYWWQADTLTKERLSWHLDMFAKMKITSLQVNYSHTDDKKGYAWGSSYKSIPAQFTDEWWKLFGWFVDEANKRNMTVSVSDYTLGLGQGYALDEVRRLHPDIVPYRLFFDKRKVSAEKILLELKDSLVSVTAFNLNDMEEYVDLSDKVKNSCLSWENPTHKEWLIVSTYLESQPRSYNPMHPLAGKEYVRCFFQRFEDKLSDKNMKGKLNFFFSDELNFNLKGITWDERFADEFFKRKGYNIRPYLAALDMNIGTITPKIRMDYNDVFTSLSEENFFIPVYQWHEDRGLIYGCDHGGRGRQVDEFGDYFRTQRWNQGPGADQPRLGKDIIKPKVASSIAHLYNRPRVWLEAFHSSGWNSTSEGIMDALYANFAMGYNLVSFHGLYYATPGSMWEWAPPCFHFRSPTWATMDKTLEISERLSYLFSQGYHQCDVAILYPVEPVVAGYNNSKKSVDYAFKAGEYLYGNGVDLDYMDYLSLQRAEIKDRELHIAGESYKAIIIPSMLAINDESLRKIGQFAQQGGIVINLGALPQATEVHGSDANYVGELVGKMISGTNYYTSDKVESILPILDHHFKRDFCVRNNQNASIRYVNHRKIDDKEVYGVYNIEKNTTCFFREKGDVEYWDALEGKRYKLKNVKDTDGGTLVKLPYGKSTFQIIVFTPRSDAPLMLDKSSIVTVKKLSQEWKSEMEPVLDNRYGDFHYPGTREKMYPEIRKYKYQLLNTGDLCYDDVIKSNEKWREVTYTYGEEFVCSGATDKVYSDKFLSTLNSVPQEWVPYEFSRKWGVLDDFGHQGFHGMKMKMNPEVIRLGKLEYTRTSTNRLKEEGGNSYYLFTTVKAPYDGDFEILSGNIKPDRCFINGNRIMSFDKVQLHKGVNTLVLNYNKPVITYFFLRDTKVKTAVQQRLTLKWYQDPAILPYDPYGKEDMFAWYSFKSAPGLHHFTVGINGEVQIFANGKEISSEQKDGLICVNLPEVSKSPIEVVMKVKLPFGVKSGAALTTELKQYTEKGIIHSGDWGKTEGLRNYSGGIKYSQVFNNSEELIDKGVILEIENLSSTVKLSINGQCVGCRVCPDWSFDISNYVQTGDNLIELTVYNTSANHYENLSTYSKYEPSGILGNVFLKYYLK